MSDSAEKRNRRLEEVIPAAYNNFQANYCRNPSCVNFGVPPRRLDPAAQTTHPSKLGEYRLLGSVGETALICSACERKAYPLSNEGLALEIHRLRTANGILTPESCPREKCRNHHRSVVDFPDDYYGHGTSGSGAVRKRCKLCKSTLTIGDHRRRKPFGAVNKDIVLDIVNRGALNAIMRKLDIHPETLYGRIDFIHEQMIAFESFKLRALRAPGWKRYHYALATDAQDCMVNWVSRERRIAIQLSTITTAENITGFIFRTDVNFDPTTGDIVKQFISMLERKEFDIPEGLGPSHRFVLPSFLRAVAHVLKSEENYADLSKDRRDELLEEIEQLLPDFDADQAPGSDNPVSGALIKKQYTAIAHFRLIAEMLPIDADLHLMSDPEGSFVLAEPIGFAQALKQQRADLTFITFDKQLSNPKKKALVAEYKRKVQKLIDELGDSKDAGTVRREFIARHGARMGKNAFGVPAEWWEVPIATMYEPNKRVGIAHQRSGTLMDDPEQHRLDLLDRASLHAADSFFNVMRQRVSYLHRPGQSRSTGSHYNSFQPYRPDMLQKIVDIARVYFNWVEPRPFRTGRKFESMDHQPNASGHERMETDPKEAKRRLRREEYSTPAMRMYLARGPIRLETILNTDWRAKLSSSTQRRAPSRKREAPPRISRTAPDTQLELR
jgi:hypothetical protein